MREQDINRPEDGKQAKNGMQTEKTIEIIRKLFSLAGNNPNLEEANSAMAKAQAMLAKYGLSEAEINMKEAEDKADEMSIDFDRETADYFCRQLTHIVCSHFKCLSYTSMLGRGRSHMVIVGMSEDLPIVKETILFAYAVFNSSFKKFMKDYKKSDEWKSLKSTSYINCGDTSTQAKRIKADYFRGFIKGMQDKFEENEKSYALIVKTPFAVTEQFNSHKFVRGGGCNGYGGAGNSQAYDSGRKEGRQIGSKQKQLA